MAYLALARKWRPKAFSDVVGQTHVVQALSNALDSGRVHHAFLFTGTRGVGKTTLARIFAKSLNCEQGVSAEPCQECNACKAIDEGRYVDLIEVDAASRTKVDDTRELLDNVQYAPTTGKYKVYLIDEVHMLSGHSFNALLKTLEEPPEHVKFLFATTDPQKLPITVLSRCLQFSLRAMRPEQVNNQLVKILTSETIEFDQQALQLIAKAADGSMRDGLSLLDQAITQGNGEVRLASVQSMLGSIKTEHTQQIITALINHDVDRIMQVIVNMADHAVDFTLALDELLMQLYQIALAQIAPQALNNSDADQPLITQLATDISQEQVQLYYQIGLISKRDIALAPSLRVGFEMALLRMLAFEPSDESANKLVTDNNSSNNPVVQDKPAVSNKQVIPNKAVVPPEHNESIAEVRTETGLIEKKKIEKNVPQAVAEVINPTTEPQPSAVAVTLSGNNEWGELIEQTNMTGLTKEMAMNCACEKITEQVISLALSPKLKHLFKPARVEDMQSAIQAYLNTSVTMQVEIEDSDKETPAECLQRLGFEQVEQAKQNLQNDPTVKAIMDEFGATIDPASIRP